MQRGCGSEVAEPARAVPGRAGCGTGDMVVRHHPGRARALLRCSATTSGVRIMGGMVKIFLSYAHEDRGRVDAVKTLLELGGAQVFIDWRSIRPGTAWGSALAHALAECDVLCVFWSAATLRSTWVRDEYTAFTRMFPDRPCVPLCADETPLPAPLAKRQAPPEFLALTNEFLALRRDLLARGVSRRESRRIVRERIARLGVQLDVTQRRKLFGLFASGMSFGLVVASVSKPLKVGAWVAVVAAAAFTWRSCSSERDPVAWPGHTVAASDQARVPVPIAAALPILDAPPVPEPASDATPTPANDVAGTVPLCVKAASGDPRCAAPDTPQYQDPAPIDEQRRAGVATAAPRPAALAGSESSGWIKLSESAVGLAAEHVRISLGPHGSQFTELALSVEGARIEHYDIRVMFENGADSRRTGGYLTPDDGFTLAGDRVITSIDLDLAFSYLPGTDSAQLAVWAKAVARTCRSVTTMQPQIRYRVVMEPQLIPCVHPICNPFGCMPLHPRGDLVTVPVQVPYTEVVTMVTTSDCSVDAPTTHRSSRWRYRYQRIGSDSWSTSIEFSSEEACARSQAVKDASPDYLTETCKELAD